MVERPTIIRTSPIRFMHHLLIASKALCLVLWTQRLQPPEGPGGGLSGLPTHLAGVGRLLLRLRDQAVELLLLGRVITRKRGVVPQTTELLFDLLDLEVRVD